MFWPSTSLRTAASDPARHEGRATRKPLGVVVAQAATWARWLMPDSITHPIPGILGRQLPGAGEIDAQIHRIPFVDANHPGRRGRWRGQLLLVAHLGEHPRPNSFATVEQGAILPLVGEHGGIRRMASA